MACAALYGRRTGRGSQIFVSQRWNDAHRLVGGDAVRRAVCSAARSGAGAGRRLGLGPRLGGPEASNTNMRFTTKTRWSHFGERVLGKHSLPGDKCFYRFGARSAGLRRAVDGSLPELSRLKFPQQNLPKKGARVVPTRVSIGRTRRCSLV